MTDTPDTATLAYETSVAALRLLDALIDGTQADAHDAAGVALRASLAVLLAITCPGGARPYYVAAADELAADVFAAGRTVAESLEVFLEHGFVRTHPTRPGHDVWTEGNAERTRAVCSCGWIGAWCRLIGTARTRAVEHAAWPVVPAAL